MAGKLAQASHSTAGFGAGCISLSLCQKSRSARTVHWLCKGAHRKPAKNPVTWGGDTKRAAKMCDMGGLDNLVANTAYLKAQGGDDKEMKKRRRSLSLPKTDQCAVVRTAIEKDFSQLCEKQPIGKKLFRQYLSSNPEYTNAASFFDDMYDWDLAEGAAKDKARQNIIKKYCKADSKNFLTFLPPEAQAKCKVVTDKDFDEVMKGNIQDAAREFLKGKPFTDYQTTPFFDKFLQWKEYEKQPISDKYFYEFRTLGKGGFGEVRVQIIF